MRIDEYIKTLPPDIINGEDVLLPDETVSRLLDFAGLRHGERFCHLGCGTGYALRVAAERGAKISGVDLDPHRVDKARRVLGPLADIRLGDVAECRLPAADLILFWFADPRITHTMPERFSAMPDGTRIVTIWGPLPGCLPDAVRFPFVLNRVPFSIAHDLKSQIQAVFGVKCISYATAWEFAERYTKMLQPTNTQNDRFLTILQALTIWFEARSLGVTCEQEVPDPVRNYVHIMRNFFRIDFGHYMNKESLHRRSF